MNICYFHIKINSEYQEKKKPFKFYSQFFWSGKGTTRSGGGMRNCKQAPDSRLEETEH